MSSAKPIKSLLLEQKLVAGSEISMLMRCWAAVHPETPAKGISKQLRNGFMIKRLLFLQLGIEKAAQP